MRFSTTKPQPSAVSNVPSGARNGRPFHIPYGGATLEIEAPGDLIRHRGVPPLDDEAAAIRHALDNPIGALPLDTIIRPGETVAILVNDITRLTRTDLFLPPLIDCLNQAGVPDTDIFIVFALGIHRPQTEAERREIIGPNLHSRLRNFDHIASDESNLVRIGTTRFGNAVHINRQVWEADRIILTGEIMYHLIAGYSGGRKSLVPGVAGWRTTTFNHNMIFDPNCRSGLLDGNPAHEDLLEACSFASPDFMVNVVLSPEGKLLRVVAGHYEKAHREGCRTVDQALSAEIGERYDLLIASAGGSPLDIDIRQAHKGLENACRALKPGGSILFYAECSNGSGHPRIEYYANAYSGYQDMETALREHFEVGGHKAYWLARLGAHYDVHLVSSLDPCLVGRFQFAPVPLAEHGRHLSGMLDRQAPGARIGIIPHAGHTLPVLKEVS